MLLSLRNVTIPCRTLLAAAVVSPFVVPSPAHAAVVVDEATLEHPDPADFAVHTAKDGAGNEKLLAAGVRGDIGQRDTVSFPSGLLDPLVAKVG